VGAHGVCERVGSRNVNLIVEQVKTKPSLGLTRSMAYHPKCSTGSPTS
jgi:hypothetical protein